MKGLGIGRLSGVVILIFSLGPVFANEVLISPLSVGSYTRTGTFLIHEPGEMLVASVSGFESRSYMVFDATEIDNLVFSLELRGNSGDRIGRINDVEIDFHRFTGSVSELTGGTIDFDELIDPLSYAKLLSPGITPANTDFSIDLSPDAVADFNSSSEAFVITVSQLIGTPTSGFFTAVTANEISLVAITAVPETSCAFFLIGLGCAHAGRRRRTVRGSNLS